MKRFTKRSSAPWAKIASPYCAWFSMPVPTQHQKESSAVE
jgi:hypothetical protein